MNDLFGEFGKPFRNSKFNPAKLYLCLKDLVFSVTWLPNFTCQIQINPQNAKLNVCKYILVYSIFFF